jgi:uncharacterized protein DUF6632
MWRDRALQVVLVLVGLLFTAAVYPVATDLWHGSTEDTGDTMMMGIYFTLGIFLLLAVRNPSAHRSLIAFAAWSSFAHAVVMSSLALRQRYASDRPGFLIGSAVLVFIGIALLMLAPAGRSTERLSAAEPVRQHGV